jgi:hypothetical protein
VPGLVVSWAIPVVSALGVPANQGRLRPSAAVPSWSDRVRRRTPLSRRASLCSQRRDGPLVEGEGQARRLVRGDHRCRSERAEPLSTAAGRGDARHHRWLTGATEVPNRRILLWITRRQTVVRSTLAPGTIAAPGLPLEREGGRRRQRARALRRVPRHPPIPPRRGPRRAAAGAQKGSPGRGQAHPFARATAPRQRRTR